MSLRVRVLGTETGIVAVKTAATPDQMADLADEATRLRQAAHPGVVALLEHRVSDDHAELHLDFAGESLERWTGTSAQAAGLIAAVAATLADLHEVGVVHGRIDATHVLLGPDRRPRLCGLSRPDASLGPPDDVAALGRLLDQFADRATWLDSKRPGAFLWPRAHVASQRALAQIVAHATDPVPSRRPNARPLARSVLAAFPDADLAVAPNQPDPGPDEPTMAPALGRSTTPAAEPPLSSTRQFRARVPQPAERPSAEETDQSVADPIGERTLTTYDDMFVDRPWDAGPHRPGQAGDRIPRRSPAGGRFATRPPAGVRKRRRGRGPVRARRRRVRMVGLVAVIGVAAVVAGAFAFRASASSDAGALGSARVPSPSTGRSCAPATSPAADIDGDGCPDAVRVAGEIVEAAGQRWAVGIPGDAVAVGDWDCDGRATPAVYRPSSGEVFVFGSWASAGSPVAAEAVARVGGGQGLQVAAQRPGESGCDMPVVDLADGGHHVVDVSP